MGITIFKIFIMGGISSDIRSEITFYGSAYLPKCKFWIQLSPKCMLTPNINHFQSKWETEIAKMDFLYHSTTLLYLFMNINAFDHLINQDLNLHIMLIENTVFYQNIFFIILQEKCSLHFHRNPDNILNASLRDIFLLKFNFHWFE